VRVASGERTGAGWARAFQAGHRYCVKRPQQRLHHVPGARPLSARCAQRRCMLYFKIHAPITINTYSGPS
jgi:hypothetical protein